MAAAVSSEREPKIRKVMGFVPEAEVVGLAVRKANRENRFGEDIGSVMAVTSDGRCGAIRLPDFLRSICLNMDYGSTSLLEKVTFLRGVTRQQFDQAQILFLDHPEPLSIEDKASLVDYVSFHAIKTSASRGGASALREPESTMLLSFEAQAAARSVRCAFADMRLAATPSKDLKLVYGLYDRVKEIFSYSSAGGMAILNPQDSYLQVLPNGIPIDLTTFQKHPPLSPMYPQGDLRTTEEFSSLAGASFDLNGFYQPGVLGNSFKNIITSANTTQPPDEKAMQILAKVKAYLYVTKKDPFTNEEYQTDSADYAAYKKDRNAYLQATAQYMAVKSNYDLTKPEDQRAWQIKAIVLQGQVDTAKEAMDAHPTTVMALKYLHAYGNNAVVNAIADGQESYTKGCLKSQVTGQPYPISYGFPSAWYANDSGYTQLSVHTKDFSSTASADATTYGGGASFSSGFFSIGGSFRSSTEQRRSHIDASDLTFAFELATIAIQRPWMDTTLFGLDEWTYGGQPPGAISKGVFPANDTDLSRRKLPYYSVAFVIIKNISVTGNWSAEDYNFLKQSFQASAEVGIGPFRLSGANYSHTAERSSFSSTYSDGKFTVPGAQIIGVINRVVPFSAPK